MTTEARTHSTEISLPKTDVLSAAAIAMFMGLVMVFTTGFASPSVLHNSAHDTRHTMAFPCH